MIVQLQYILLFFFAVALDAFFGPNLIDECFIISPLNIFLYWGFGPRPCTDLYSYVCEFPRVSMTED